MCLREVPAEAPADPILVRHDEITKETKTLPTGTLTDLMAPHVKAQDQPFTTTGNLAVDVGEDAVVGKLSTRHLPKKFLLDPVAST